MNGFSYSTDRWFFIIVFFVNVAAVLVMEEQLYMSKRMRYVFWLVAGISITMHVIFNDKNSGMLIRIAVFGVCCICLPYLWNYRKKREWVLLAFCTMLAALMGLFSYGPKILGGSGYSAGFKENGVYAEIKRSAEKINDEQYKFKRYDVYDSSLGSSLVMDYFGTTEYFSVLNAYVSEFYQNINISPGVRAASHILRGLDGRKELEALLSVSQYMDFETGESGETFSKILPNKDYLPLGFTYDTYLVRSDFENLNSIEKQSLLLTAVVLEEEQSTTESVKAETVVNSDKEINFQILENDDENRMRVYIDFDQYSQYKDGIGEIYVQFCGLSGSADIYVGNKDFQLRDETFLYYLGEDEFWINLSELEENEQGLYFDLYIDGISDFSESKMHVWWHEISYEAISKRSENTVSNLELGNNSVKGNITCEADEILFFSIPFSSGWTAYVDGKETEIKRADIAFMAIMPGEGEHEILLKYESPGMKSGLIISVSMALIWVMIFIFWNNKLLKRQ